MVFEMKVWVMYCIAVLCVASQRYGLCSALQCYVLLRNVMGYVVLRTLLV
jgi:hypothetical protein